MKIFTDFNFKNHELITLKKISKYWNFWSYEETLKTLKLKNNYLIYYYDENKPNEWLSLLLFSYNHSICEILFIFVDQNFRHQGLGMTTLMTLEKKLKKEFGYSKIYLEVNENSLHAIKLYKKFGMSLLSVRKKYYKNKDNALIFNKEIHND